MLGLARGIERRGTNVFDLVKTTPELDSQLHARLALAFSRAAYAASDLDEPEAVRGEQIDLMYYARGRSFADTLVRIISRDESAALRAGSRRRGAEC